MKKNTIVIVLAIFVLVLASLACNAVAGGPLGISNVRLTSDVEGKTPITVYSPSDPTFYCYFELNNAPADTKIKGVWTLVSAEGYTSDTEIDSAEITGSDNTYYFKLDRSTDAWPVGKYKVDLYVNDKLVQTQNFEVK